MTENQIENELKYYSFHENKKEKESKNKILNDVSKRLIEPKSNEF